MFNTSTNTGHSALVSRPADRPRDPSLYLLITADGASSWTADPTAATTFACMREAIRAATRLPCSVRAFGLPAAGSF
jgi:hypothetical protein